MATMWKLAPWFLATIIALVVPVTAWADEPQGASRDQNKLIGTWKQVSAKYGGQEYKFPEGTTTLKHVTPTQFMWTSYDSDGKMTRAAGGSYTLKGEAYVETPEYGLS